VNRLERAGRAIVDDPVAEPRAVDEIARDAHHRRTRRLTGTGATALVLVAALVVSVLALTRDDDPQVIAGPSDPDALYADATWHRTFLAQAPLGDGGGDAGLNTIAFDGSTFVAAQRFAGELGVRSELWSSTDGRSWSARPLEVPGDSLASVISDVVSTGSGFVAIGLVQSGVEFATAVWTSDDGREWRYHEITDVEAMLVDAAVWRDEVLVTGSVLGGELRALIATYAGGNELEPLLPPADTAVAGGHSIAIDRRGNVLVAGAWSDGGVTWASSDGVTWRTARSEGPFGKVVGFGSGFIGFAGEPGEPDEAVISLESPDDDLVLPHQPTTVWRSTDGLAWEMVGDGGHLPGDASIRDAIAVPEGLVAVGEAADGTAGVWTSRDAVEWTRVVDATGAFAGDANEVVLNTVMWTGGELVIGGGVREPSGDGFTPTIWSTTDELDREPATTTTTVATTTITHPILGPVLRPGELAVAAGTDGLLAVDRATGDARALIEHDPTTGVVIDVSVAPDGSVWYSVSSGLSTQVDPSIWRLDTSGAPDLVVPFGSAPAVSPDGRYLAYADAPPGEQQAGIRRRDIVIRDLETGDERRYAPRADDPDFFKLNGSVQSIAWSPDGTTIAYGFEYEGRELYEFRPDQVDSLSDATGYDGAYTSPFWLSDQVLLAVERCCYPEGEQELVTVRVVQLQRGGQAAAPVPTLSGLDLVQVGMFGDTVFGVTADGELWVEDDANERTLLATGVHDAAG